MFQDLLVRMLHRVWGGVLVAIFGCMFARKTTTFLARGRAERESGRVVIFFKPDKDDRYAEDKIVSHDGDEEPATPVHDAWVILSYLLLGDETIDVVAIDEAQFFGADLLVVVAILLLLGVDVIVAGLDLDYRAQPFGPMPTLISWAKDSVQVFGECECGEQSTHSYREGACFGDEGEVEQIGNNYTPYCEGCWTSAMGG